MPIYEKFVGASRDDFLSLKDAQHNYNLTFKENFNFAYDVVDAWGEQDENKLALVWCDDEGNRKI